MDIGHVHLNVRDLDRSIAFYRDVLGLEVMLRMPKFAFLSSNGYHHHVALDSRVGDQLGSTEHPGLHHFALRHETRSELASTIRRAQSAGVSVERAADFWCWRRYSSANPTAMASSSRGTAPVIAGRTTGPHQPGWGPHGPSTSKGC